MSKTMAVSGQELVVEIEGESYSLTTLPAESSAVVLVEKDKLLGAVDLKTLVDNLGIVGGFIRVAYNGVGAAGPRFTEVQIEIQCIGYDVTKLGDKLALTVAKFKKASRTILTDLQATYEYLLDNLEEMAVMTLADVSKIAGEIVKAALELHHDFEEQQKKVVATLEGTHHAKGEEAQRIRELQKERAKMEEEKKEQMKLMQDAATLELEAEARRRHLESKEDEAVHGIADSPEALKELSAVMMQAALFWKQMQDHCRSLAESDLQRQVEKAMKYPEEKRLKVWTSSAFKRKAVEFYAGWVALHSVCAVYMERIKLTQKDLYLYIQENPTYEQSRQNLKALAEELLTDLRMGQKAITDKEFQTQEEIKALGGNPTS